MEGNDPSEATASTNGSMNGREGSRPSGEESDALSRWLPRMQRERTPRAEVVMLRVLADFLAIALAFVVAAKLYGGLLSWVPIDRGIPDPDRYLPMASGFGALTLCVFWYQNLYRGRATVLNLWELESAVKGILLSAALLFAGLFFLELQAYSRVVVLSAIGLAAVFVVIERRLVCAFLKSLHVNGASPRRILVYGCDDVGQLLMKKIIESPSVGATVVGYLDDFAPLRTTVACRITQSDPVLYEVPILGRLEDLEEVVGRFEVDEILVAVRSLDQERLQWIFDRSREHGLSVGVVPNLADVRSDQLYAEDLSSIPVLRPRVLTARRIHRLLKEAFDRVAALALAIVTAPLWGVIAALIRLDSPGPVVFGQERVGRNGRRFRVLKFRTMQGDTQPYASSPQGDDIDPRITRIGRFLRTTGLDELPQLINVLRGEMSLVGPRPEMPHIVERYNPIERQRLRVKPGITGLWQISPDRHAEIHENIHYDLYYVQQWSFLLDLMILMETAFLTVGALVTKLVRRRAKRKPAGRVQMIPREAYVLVALDQRWDGDVPVNWKVLAPAAYEMSPDRPVRIVVTDANRPALDRLLAEAMGRLGVDGCTFAYTSYRSRSDLRQQVVEARLVITDLPHVERWARESGTEVVFAEEGRLKWWPRARVPDPVVSDLSKCVEVEVAPELERRFVSGSGTMASQYHLPLFS